MKLKKWALLDIETTGIRAQDDDIIDIGFLCFDGLKLTKKYSSLVRTEKEITPFIKHLTGISQSMVKTAPTWESVQDELNCLEEHTLIAHNAAFENGFLESDFEFIGVNPKKSEFGHYFSDSILFLALLHPGRTSLNLASFIVDYEIAEKEIHRGYEDSRDLLKVLLRATYELHDDSVRFMIVKNQLMKIDNFWFQSFIQLSKEDLLALGKEIEFDVIREVKSAEEVNDKSLKTSTRGFSGSEIKGVFEDKDLMGQHFGSYEPREQQVQMSLKIGQSFANNIHSIIQAPTGTGKTLSYLVPSLLFAKAKDKQVLLSTGTKVLQSQLELKDLEKALDILSLHNDITYAKLIGTTNHLCLAKHERSKSSQSSLFAEDFAKSYLQAYFEILFAHNESSEYQDMLTKEDLPFVLSRIFKEYHEVVGEISLDFKSCLGHRCPFVKNCSYFSGLEKAKTSDVIIGNHALTFSWPQSIDRPEYIVFDEAHKIEESATTAFSQVTNLERLSKFFSKPESGSSAVGALYYLLDFHEISYDPTKFRAFINESFAFMKNLSAGLSLITEKIAKEKTRYTSEYWNEFSFKKGSSPLEVSLYNEISSLSEKLNQVKMKIIPFYKILDETEFEDHHSMMAWTQFRGFFNQLDEFDVKMSLYLSEDDEYCRSVKFHEEQGTEFYSVPIDIGRFVHEEVIKPSSSVIFTSATLGSMDGQYGKVNSEWLTGYMLADPSRRFQEGLYLDPVFDYKKNAKVFLATNLPPIYTNDYIDQAISKIIPYIKSLGGKSLLLFSSYKRFELARQLILLKLQGHIDVFYQGMGPKVVDEFKNAERGVLLGLESFGEGIDIPGESLKFVYIDKIPDMEQSLIIEERKKFFDRNLGNSFSEYFMATRARKLQQKLGRLIRTKDDCGTILITDPRVDRWKNRTIDEFKKYLSPYDVEKIKLEDFKFEDHSQ